MARGSATTTYADAFTCPRLLSKNQNICNHYGASYLPELRFNMMVQRPLENVSCAHLYRDPNVLHVHIIMSCMQYPHTGSDICAINSGILNTQYKNWRPQPKEPHFRFGERHCVAMEFQNSTWFTATCTDLKPFICSRSDIHPCKKCKMFSGTLHTGAMDITDCVCNEGWFGADGSRCWQCPGGTYKNFRGRGPCLSCSAGKYQQLQTGRTQDCTDQCPTSTTYGSTTYAHAHGGSQRLSTGHKGPYRCMCAPGHAPDPSNIQTKNNFGMHCKPCPSNNYAAHGAATVEVLGNCNCSQSSGCSPAGAGSGRSWGNLSLTNAEYRDNADCRWRIKSDDGSTISLWFTRIDIEEGYDNVRVKSCQSITNDTCVSETDVQAFSNGAYQDHISMRELYQSGGHHWANFHTYVSRAGIFEVEFSSDRTVSYNGFDIFWIVTPKCVACPGIGSLAPQGVSCTCVHYVLSLSINMYTRARAHTHTHTHTHVYIYMCVYQYLHSDMPACTSWPSHMQADVLPFLSLALSLCECVCLCVCVCVCVCVRVCIRQHVGARLLVRPGLH